MEEYVWQCCRFCLSAEDLNPIFTMPEHKEKYTSTIYEATGINVDISDIYSKQVCSGCIAFINKSIKFRRKCAHVQKTFEKKVNKLEVDATDMVDSTAINISHLSDNHYGDYEDNIMLDTFQFSDTHISEVQTDIEANIEDKKFNMLDSDICDSVSISRLTKDIPRGVESVELSNISKDVKGTVDSKLLHDNEIKRRTKRRVNSIKADSAKKDGNKEEIECEHCHKILTSKLSIRNHYKIHTGFDIVCEHCGKKFITRRLLLMHCRAKHGYEKTDKCSYCDYKASNAEQVKIHERLHTGEKPFVCKECDAGFHRKSSYLQHIAIHLPEKTVQVKKNPGDQTKTRNKEVMMLPLIRLEVVFAVRAVPRPLQVGDADAHPREPPPRAAVRLQLRPLRRRFREAAQRRAAPGARARQPGGAAHTAAQDTVNTAVHLIQWHENSEQWPNATLDTVNSGKF